MSHQTKLSCLLVLVLALGGCGGDDGTTPPFGPLDATVGPSSTADATTPGPTTPGPTTPGPTTPGPTTPGPTTPGPTTPTPKPDASTGPVAEAGAPDATTAGDGGTEAGPVVTPPTGEGFIRGEAPTEASILKAGPYPVMKYTAGFAKGAGVDSSTVHHPGGDAKPPFAGIAVVPGFVSPESSIQEWGPFLASYGIVTVTIGVPGGDQPDQRAMKLMSTLEGLKKENTRADSPLMGKLDLTRLAVSGWSMGGGGTLISAAAHPELKAVMSFAAWGPSGGSKNKVPSLMFEATADALAAGMSDGFYRDTPATTPKMLFEVQGSSHNVANSPKNHNNIIGAYGLSWMKVFLEGDERYRQFLLRPFPSIATTKSAHNLK